MANIVDLEVMCGKRHMEVAVTFDKPFNGIIFSKGAVDRYNCIYVKPQTGLSKYKFDIMYDQCGSKPDLNGRFYENNIVIQYDKDLIEVWDEAKRLRCEWYNDYEKGVTKPPIRVSDIEVVELNFRGDNVDCWMEIQQGKGPWASPVTGIVPLGTTLTMVVGIDDKEGEFDMRVKSCEASDNQNRPIQLSDSDGCVLRPKMVSKFMKMRSTDPRATVVTYAFFHAFKFPDSMAVHIKCKVEICRYGCPDHCQSPTSYTAREQEVSSNLNSYATSSNRRVFPPPPPVPQQPSNYNPDPRNNRIAAGSIYAPQLPRLPRPQALVSENKPRLARKNSEIQEEGDDNQDVNRVGQAKSADAGLGDFLGGLKLPELPELPLPELPNFPTLPSLFGGSKDSAAKSKSDNGQAIPVRLGIKPDTDESSSVPVHRTLNQGQPLVFPSSFNTAGAHVKPIEPLYANTNNGYAIPYGPRALHVGADGKTIARRRREAEVLSRQERSADIGVQSGYEVVSEVDLDFTPDEVQRSVATFQGKIQEDVIYGVCLPATGFSALFVLLALMTVVSVIVSAFICYHRQLAKVAEESAPEPTAAAAAQVASINPGTVQTSLMLKEFNAWFRKQHQQHPGMYPQ
eukprot:05768.XXX_46130_42144_1 [CDS] Oithona nana genome sequencing.